MELQKKLVLGLSLLALFGTVTNYVFFSPLLTLLLPLAIFVFNKRNLQRPILWLYVFGAMFLLSVLIYDPISLVTFGFYRYDGNFVISYSPLFILPLFAYQFDLEKYMRYFYLFAFGLYGLVFIYHLSTIAGSLDIRGLVFGGLFLAQNAVGGFLAILASLGFAYYYNRRRKKELFIFLVILAMLVATYSRGSILGLLLGIIAWYLATTRRFKLLLATIAAPIILTIGCVMVGYPYYQNVLSVQNKIELSIDSDVGVKNANVLLRVFYTFPRAYYFFEHSPIIGNGVGSYDDRPIDLVEVIPAVSYNAQQQKAHSDSHAHHSYLHFLAEMGVVGLALFLVFWISLFFYLMNIRGSPIMRDFLLIAYFTLTFAAFTEHRITTPSNMLPFTISVGLFMMQKRKDKTYIVQEVE